MSKWFLVLVVAAVMSASPAVSWAGELTLRHGGEGWDGATVPNRGICTRRGGEGWSPEIVIGALPKDAVAVELRFTDEDWNEEGAHGIVRIPIDPGVDTLTVPSFQGETDALPEGMSAIASHQCGKCGGGVYLGPCSGGREHAYVVNAYALDANGSVLASGLLALGVY